jgi:hypothetical protein
MLVKFAYDPALKPVSGFVRQAGDDDALGHLRPSPDRLDELSVHSRHWPLVSGVASGAPFSNGSAQPG